MRYLAIDLGDKRTGLAVGDAVTRVVSPLGVVGVSITERGGEALIEALVRAVGEQFSEHTKAEIVIGLPLNMDGTEGPRAKMVREFAARIRAKLKPARVMHFQDERLTSVEADWGMARSGRTRGEKKKVRDAMAAGVMLGDFLAGLGSREGPADR